MSVGGYFGAPSGGTCATDARERIACKSHGHLSIHMRARAVFRFSACALACLCVCVWRIYLGRHARARCTQSRDTTTACRSCRRRFGNRHRPGTRCPDTRRSVADGRGTRARCRRAGGRAGGRTIGAPQPNRTHASVSLRCTRPSFGCGGKSGGDSSVHIAYTTLHIMFTFALNNSG